MIARGRGGEDRLVGTEPAVTRLRGSNVQAATTLRHDCIDTTASTPRNLSSHRWGDLLTWWQRSKTSDYAWPPPNDRRTPRRRVRVNTDLTAIEWRRGAYDVAGLSGLYTGNDARAAIVLKALARQVTDTSRMRALGFCVSVAHAEYMARVFTEAGIPSRALSGQTPLAERAYSVAALRNRDIRCLFTVDLFNEGIDLPDLDTLLLLRPTSSSTVFLQQLGRGLRRTPGKAVLTVLDFIGQHRREYRFDLRYRALTGTSRGRLEKEIERGFPFLSSGSQIVLDRVARDIVLGNVRGALSRSRRELLTDLRSHGDLPLGEFLSESGRELADVYRWGQSWTALRREAGLLTLPAGPYEDALLRRVVSLSHVDDPGRAVAVKSNETVDLTGLARAGWVG